MSAVLTDVIHIVLVFTTNYAAYDMPIYYYYHGSPIPSSCRPR